MNANRHAEDAKLTATQLVLMAQDLRDRSNDGLQPSHTEIVAILNTARQVATHAAQTVAALSRIEHVAANDTEGGAA